MVLRLVEIHAVSFVQPVIYQVITGLREIKEFLFRNFLKQRQIFCWKRKNAMGCVILKVIQKLSGLLFIQSIEIHIACRFLVGGLIYGMPARQYFGNLDPYFRGNLLVQIVGLDGDVDLVDYQNYGQKCRHGAKDQSPIGAAADLDFPTLDSMVNCQSRENTGENADKRGGA